MSADDSREASRSILGRGRATADWFTTGARYWLDVYDGQDLEAHFYRRRLQTSLDWIDSSGLLPGARVLDAGCGTGHLTVALARRGTVVTSTDLSDEMTRLTRQQLDAEQQRSTLVCSDVHQLPFPDGAFQAVIALGVLPWVGAPARVMAELSRVTAPGGHVLVTFDNAHRLFRLTDPSRTPPVRRLRSLLRRRAHTQVGNHMTTPGQARETVRAAGLHIVQTGSVGFGPPTFLGRQVVSARLALRIDARLQRRADRARSPLGQLGTHYLVLARRSTSSPSVNGA